MRVPPGYFQISSIPTLNDITDAAAWVCKLKKSIYGLKQASRCWFTKFLHTLKYYGFVQSHVDNSFTYQAQSQFIAMLVYVYDILMTGTSSALIQDIIAFMAKELKVIDMGPLKYFLGIEATRSSTSIYLHQRKYTLGILLDIDLSGSKPSKVPMEQNHTLLHNYSTFLSESDAFQYRRLVGRIIYLTVTKPDLAYSVQVLSQFLAKPRLDLLIASYKVVKYLEGTPGQGILMASNSKPTLSSWCDSD